MEIEVIPSRAWFRFREPRGTHQVGNVFDASILYACREKRAVPKVQGGGNSRSCCSAPPREERYSHSGMQEYKNKKETSFRDCCRYFRQTATVCIGLIGINKSRQTRNLLFKTFHHLLLLIVDIVIIVSPQKSPATQLVWPVEKRTPSRLSNLYSADFRDLVVSNKKKT